MSMFHKLKISFENKLDIFRIKRARNNEIKKFEDPKRREITSSFNISSEQKDLVDKLYECHYGEKIPYTWHQHYSAYTGNFDVNYFPELLYIPEFEHYMNNRHCYEEVYADKNVINYIANSCKIRTPQNIFSCVDGLYRNQHSRAISKEDVISGISDYGYVFVKPSIDTSSGRGCFVANFRKGIDLYSKKKSDDIIDMLGKNFCIQHIIECSDSIRNLNKSSVNTFRVITYRWKGKIYHMPVIMRIGRSNSNVDNAHAGGMFIAIEDSGILHKTAFTEFNEKFDQHPDSKIVFDGYKIQNFTKVIEAAHKLHEAIPQLGVYNWDFTIDANETPILIEANTRGGSIWMLEMAHGKGCFGDNTIDILEWLKINKSIKKSDRQQCLDNIL